MAEAADGLPPRTGHGPLFPVALALTAGFADAFGYLKLHGLLTAHVTGNLTFMVVGLAQGNPHIIMKFLALPLFMLGVSGATVFMTWLSDRHSLTLTFALLLEAGLLLLCLVAGLALPPCRTTDDLTGFCVGTILIMSMALQNAIMRLPLKKLPSTTAMTTNITEVTVQMTHALVGFGRAFSAAEKRALFEGAKRVGQTVLAFAIGGLAGGLAGVRLGYGGLLAPICILVGLALAMGRNRTTLSLFGKEL